MKFTSVQLLVFSCFVATFVFYVERTGFPIVFTSAAKTIGGKGLDESSKGSVLSSFYWGYASSQVPASWVAHKQGGFYTLAGAFACWSSLCLAESVVLGVVPLLMLVRVAIGVSQGFVIPSIHCLLAAAMGKGDKSKAVSFVTSGMYLGSSTCYLIMPNVVKYFGTGVSLCMLGVAGYAWLLMWFLMKGTMSMMTKGLKTASRWTLVALSLRNLVGVPICPCLVMMRTKMLGSGTWMQR